MENRPVLYAEFVLMHDVKSGITNFVLRVVYMCCVIPKKFFYSDAIATRYVL